MSHYQVDPDAVTAICNQIEDLEGGSGGVAGAVGTADASLDAVEASVAVPAPYCDLAGTSDGVQLVRDAVSRFFTRRADFPATHQRVLVVASAARQVAAIVVAADDQMVDTTVDLLTTYARQDDFAGFSLPAGWR